MKKVESLESVHRQAHDRLYPSLTNPNYLVLSRRREIFAKWIESRDLRDIAVLDVGGRIQPYRSLLADHVRSYISVDVAESPLVTVRGSAEALPLGSESFDVVICTQAFEYFAEPSIAAREIHRVLRPGGIALLSVASFYPRAVDKECWRFFPRGIRYVLRPFRHVEIIAEGSSISGFIRATAACLVMFARFDPLRTLVRWTVVPLLNLTGRVLDEVVQSKNDQATGNFSVLAEK